MAKDTNIQTVSGRAKLAPRREPYWERVGQGCYLGYRCMTPGKPGTWMARHYDEATGSKPTKALGDFADQPDNRRYDLAKAAASDWFTHLKRGGAKKSHTVGDAVDEYLSHTKQEKGDDAEKDARSRLTRLVKSDAKLSDLDLGKLTPGHVNAWRKALAAPSAQGRTKSKATINRDLSAFRAALNHAYRAGWVTSDHAWKNPLLPMAGVENRRDVYLSADHRRALVAACPDDLASLVRCLSLLPLRPGAAAGLKAGDFDAQHGTLTISKDKAAAGRKIPLPAHLIEFFKPLVKNKLPGAFMFARADGRPWDKDMWKYPLRDAATAAELPAGTVLYSLRHSTITHDTKQPKR